jgi:hypothetical protein
MLIKSAHALLYAFAIGASDALVLVSPQGSMARHLRKLRALAETILVFAGRITRHNFRRRPGLRSLPKGHGGHEDESREHEAHCKALHGRLSAINSR